jgi:hypothetical protein
VTVKRITAAVAATVTAAAVVAGCGAQAVTKHEVMARADAICSTALGDARALKQGGAADAVYLGQLATVVETEARKLRALPRPAADRAVLDLFITNVARAAGQYRQLAAAARAGDQATVRRLTAELAANPEATYASSYGLRECAGRSGTLVSH